ncbi:hypothetical protein RPIT_10345 [Tessaracoccus flavus]|uniref:Uncharacterized protein n=1 Tax=Tessaracoccus flavus TaxID=1610493 RepID=A0A1Q2CGB0_9ACTN|nr:hypothetical protein RPIT_10345 [Tessaracoccus flavus]SDY55214.1 ABC-2 type transport system ATP-binding protein [Tessaracoccus flavus]
MAEAVTVRAVGKVFHARHSVVEALDDVTFSVARGEIVALMGANGAGKSTLLDLICGLTTPTSGDVRVFGQAPRDAVLAGRLGAMLQMGGLLPDLTVAETVRLIASFYDRPIDVDEVLRTAGVEDIAGRRIAVCSGGEQQRVKFALALLPGAPLLVLDEPTAGMDWRARSAFWERMRMLTAEGRTLLYSSHYADEVEAVADRVVVLAEGRLVADIGTDEISAAAPTRVVQVDSGPRCTADALRALPGVRSADVDSGRVDLVVDAEHVSELVVHLLSTCGAGNLQVLGPPFFESLDALISQARRTP